MARENGISNTRRTSAAERAEARVMAEMEAMRRAEELLEIEARKARQDELLERLRKKSASKKKGEPGSSAAQSTADAGTPDGGYYYDYFGADGGYYPYSDMYAPYDPYYADYLGEWGYPVETGAPVRNNSKKKDGKKGGSAPRKKERGSSRRAYRTPDRLRSPYSDGEIDLIASKTPTRRGAESYPDADELYPDNDIITRNSDGSEVDEREEYRRELRRDKAVRDRKRERRIAEEYEEHEELSGSHPRRDEYFDELSDEFDEYDDVDLPKRASPDPSMTAEEYEELLQYEAHIRERSRERREASEYDEYLEFGRGERRGADEYFDELEDTDGEYESDAVRSATDEEKRYSALYEEEDSIRHYERAARDEDDRRAIAEYENDIDLMGVLSPSGASDISDSDVFRPRHDPLYSHLADAGFEKKELAAMMRKNDKTVRAHKKELSRIEAKLSSLDAISRMRSIIDAVNIHKHIIDLRVEVLSAICTVKNRPYLGIGKRYLKESVREYNLAADEYEAEGGRRAPRPSPTLVDEILRGSEREAVPVLHYPDEEGFEFKESGRAGFGMSRAERRAYHEEQMRFAKEAEQLEEDSVRPIDAKRFSEQMRIFRRKKYAAYLEKINAAASLAGAAADYKSARAEAELDMAELSFFSDPDEKEKTVSELRRDIRYVEKRRTGAAEQERADAARYYSVIASPITAADGRAARDTLLSLRAQLESLMRERERIDSQLSRLYSGGGEPRGASGFNRRIVKKRKAAAAKVNRRFRSEMKLLEKKIPLDIKHRLVRAVNGIMKAEAELAELRYRIRKQEARGAVKREMQRTIKDLEREIKSLVREEKFFLKKAKRYAKEEDEEKSRLSWFFGTMAVLMLLAVIGAIVWEPVLRLFGVIS